jgi:hypothetical protein
MENKVTELYDVACIFLSLPITSRYLVGTHFRLLSDTTLAFGNRDHMDETIFRGVFEKGIYKEFKSFIQAFKESRSHEYPIKH